MNIKSDILGITLRVIVWLLVFALPTIVLAQEATETPDGGLPRSEAGQILFVRSDDMFVIDADGSNEQRLSDMESVDAAIWMPDGNHIVLARDATLYLMSADGEEIQQIVELPSSTFESLLTASPDGTRLLWGNQSRDDTGVYVVDLASGTLELLHRRSPGDSSYSWSPDSSQILYVNNNNSLGIVTINTGEERTILVEELATSSPDGGFAAWSPDGASLVVSQEGETDGYTALAIISLDGTKVRRFAERDGRIYDIQWSPDGEQIAYVLCKSNGSLRPGFGLVQIVDVASEEVRIANPTYIQGHFYDLAWSQDSQHLIFNSYILGPFTNIYRVNADEQQITPLLEDGYWRLISPNWRP